MSNNSKINIPETATETDIKNLKSILPIYQSYREKVTHEDGLINQRTTWLVTFNAFLFTALALTIKSNLSGDISENLIWCYVGAGIGSSIATLISVNAAMKAINAIRDSWKIQFKDIFDKKDLLPALVGSGKGSNSEHLEGMVAPYSLPIVLFLVWFFVIVNLDLLPIFKGCVIC